MFSFDSTQLEDFSKNSHPMGAANAFFDEAYGWYTKQSSAKKIVEAVGLATLGAAAMAVTRGRIGGFIGEKSVIGVTDSLNSVISTEVSGKSFAHERYLAEPYLITSGLKKLLSKTSADLPAKYPEFKVVVAAGGQANGSFVFRSLTKNHPASDFDFYLVGKSTTPQHLREISDQFGTAVRVNKLTLDGVLNGRNPEIYLNLDELPRHIQDGDFNLMALPFQAAFGKVEEAQRAVLHSVMEHPRKQEVWDSIVDAHAESLSMHHGSWSIEFNNSLLQDFLPEKIDKFGLPNTPERALAEVGK